MELALPDSSRDEFSIISENNEMNHEVHIRRLFTDLFMAVYGQYAIRFNCDFRNRLILYLNSEICPRAPKARHRF